MHAWCALIGLLATAGAAAAHDLERTQVSLTFARDGSFVPDVANDPAWLQLRLESIPGPFADRVVLWVDGREIRPESVEFICVARAGRSTACAAACRSTRRRCAGSTAS